MYRFRSLTSSFATTAVIRCVSQSKEFAAACHDLPTTPSGANPYNVLEISVTLNTTQEDVSKQFRQLVVKNHPDKPGGSTERMSEINLAYKIVKEHHEDVLRKMTQVATHVKANEAYRQHRHARVDREEELGRTGGVRRQNVKVSRRSSPSGRARSLKEVEAHWERYREDVEASVRSMCNRYEMAIQQGRFFRKSAALNELTVRERWLRKSFLKGLWEDVHELRGELLRRGARSAQQSQLAEEMVLFASLTQRKLNDDFQRLTQGSVQAQSRMFVERGLIFVIFAVALVKFWRWVLSSLRFSNPFASSQRKSIPSP